MKNTFIVIPLFFGSLLALSGAQADLDPDEDDNSSFNTTDYQRSQTDDDDEDSSMLPEDALIEDSDDGGVNYDYHEDENYDSGGY